jgi:predicted phosphodiesterase
MEAYDNPNVIWRFVKPMAKVAVVAGDIHSKRFEQQLTEIASRFDQVIAIYGNHEWYRRDISWRADPALLPNNVALLNPGVFELDDVVFIGATLWTDFKGRDWFTMHTAKDMISDFHVIRSHNYQHKFTPHMAADKHDREKAYLKLMIEKYRDLGKKIVIVTHFIPTYDLVLPKWKLPHTNMLNYYFSAQCEDVFTMEGVKTWIFGHTHDYIDRKLGDVRFVCNPLGYPRENIEFRQKVIVV